MKKTISWIIAALLLFGGAAHAFAQTTEVPDEFGMQTTEYPLDAGAIPTMAYYVVNGESAAPSAYTIGGVEYIKLRDLAFMLDGTEKRFSVFEHDEMKAVETFAGEAYIPDGGEMRPAREETIAIGSPYTLYADGKTLERVAYSIGGYLYFPLEALAELYDFSLLYDDVTDTFTMDTGKPSYRAVILAARNAAQNAVGQNTSAVTIAVMVDHQIIYAQAFSNGVQNVDIQTAFNVGSIGKLFTMTAALQLSERGLLKLDAAVSEYLPQFHMADARYRDITVRMLLNHSAGFPGTYLHGAFTAQPNPAYLENLLLSLQTQTLTADPGTVSVYSNDGWSLLQLVVEAAAGEPLLSYVQSNIFTPAGMARSFASAEPLDSNLAHIVTEDAAYPWEMVNALGAGGFSSTAADLCRFADALLTGKLLDDDSFAKSTSKQTAPDTVPFGQPNMDFGYGWDYADMPQFDAYGVRVLGKSGGTVQFNSQLSVLPERGAAIAVSVGGSAKAVVIADAVTKALLETLGYSAGAYSLPQAQPAELPEAMMKYEGYYSGAMLQKVAFDTAENTLLMDVQFNGAMVSLDPVPYTDDGSFRSGANALVFDDSTGRNLLISETNGRTDVMGEQLAPNRDIDASLFAGETWIPYDLPLYDLLTDTLYTDVFTGMPGYIMAGSGSALVPYPLADEYSTAFALSHRMDQLTLRIEDQNGQDILSAAGNRYQRASAVEPLAEDAALTADAQGHSIARTVTRDGMLTVNAQGDVRIVVYRNTGMWDAVFDSLLQGRIPVSVAEGDILLLVLPPQGTAAVTVAP